MIGIYYAGLSEGNSGEIRIGAVLQDLQGKVVREMGWAYPKGKYGTADWLGMLTVLKLAQFHNCKITEVRGSSKNAVLGMTGKWKVKAAHSLPIAQECWRVAAEIVGVQSAPIQFREWASNAAGRVAYRKWKDQGTGEREYKELREQLWLFAEKSVSAVAVVQDASIDDHCKCCKCRRKGL